MWASKKCGKCGETKSVEEFDLHNTATDGYKRLCKTCRNAPLLKWQQWELAGEKPCNVCGLVKPLDQFQKFISARRRTYSGRCKSCGIKLLHERQIAKFGSRRFAHLYRRYGVDQQKWDEMIAEQLALCAICLVREPTVVDHDHKSGKTRALLCNSCNVLLGIAEANEGILDRMRDYIKKHEVRQLHVV